MRDRRRPWSLEQRLPPWVFFTTFPLWIYLAVLVGGSEHRLLRAQLVAVDSASDGTGGGPLLLALLPAALDVAAVGWCLALLQRALPGYRQTEDGFPWARLAGLVCANALCLRCSLALGAVTVWASILAMALWTIAGGGE